ncbi:MAG TPA: DUF6364 family protein [Flavobacteriales bacterium]|nr:DUF6364 family protein [Flavobacteriales bacterium]HNK70147.1 DUF6364 family protein [Flavobacteriales bacterium]HNO05844.1 DUF6364 family protein [Flavobacteriales bacterium]
MKRKVTLSVKAETLAKMKAEGRRHRTSMSEEVERRFDQEEPKPDGPSPFMRWGGKFADWFTEADFEANDWIGEELRKTEAYQRLQERRKQRKKSA